MNHKGTAYLLWLTIFLGLGGIHRFYNGKLLTGLLWLFTGGLFGVGQLIDLILIPDMVDEHNFKRARRLGSSFYDPAQPAISRTVDSYAKPQAEQLSIKLLKAAQKRGGQLSVTQGVSDTGADFGAVEAALLQMAKKGYASIDNDAKSGAVIYRFPEL
jgi:TM2 domain-containing membrane protein YozV